MRMMDKNNEMKCRYYNRGYCKQKESCDYYHPTRDCLTRCTRKNVDTDTEMIVNMEINATTIRRMFVSIYIQITKCL